MTSRGRGVSVILEMEQEQPFWVEKKIWLKGSYAPTFRGQHAEELILKAPGMGGRWVTDIIADNDQMMKVILYEWPIRFQECSSFQWSYKWSTRSK
jgi:hypothetical protein